MVQIPVKKLLQGIFWKNLFREKFIKGNQFISIGENFL